MTAIGYALYSMGDLPKKIYNHTSGLHKQLSWLDVVPESKTTISNYLGSFFGKRKVHSPVNDVVVVNDEEEVRRHLLNSLV